MASSWRYDTEIRARARGLGYRLGIVGVRQLLDLRVGPLELRREPAHLRLQVVVLPLGAGARQRAVPHGERVRDGLGTFAQVAHRLLPLLAPRRDRPRLLLALLPQLLRLEEERPARREAARVAAREALRVVGEEAAEQLVPKQREQARVPAEHRQRALPRVAHYRTPKEVGRRQLRRGRQRLTQPHLDVHGTRREAVALLGVRLHPVREHRTLRAVQLLIEARRLLGQVRRQPKAKRGAVLLRPRRCGGERAAHRTPAARNLSDVAQRCRRSRRPRRERRLRLGRRPGLRTRQPRREVGCRWRRWCVENRVGLFSRPGHL